MRGLVEEFGCYREAENPDRGVREIRKIFGTLLGITLHVWSFVYFYFFSGFGDRLYNVAFYV